MKDTASKGKKKKRNKKLAAGVIFFEVVIAVVLLVLLYQNMALNSQENVTYADESFIDDIKFDNGKLSVNNVSVEVPTNNNVTYNISYAWAKDDEEYPSVPHVATASYGKKDGSVAYYDISLYRDSYVEKDDIPEGKTADNWFDDWEVGSGKTSSPRFEDVDKIHGYYVSTIDSKEDSASGDEYRVVSYYVATEAKDGIAVYILEGILYEPELSDDFLKVFDKCMSSMKIDKKAAPKADKTTDKKSNDSADKSSDTNEE